MGNPIKVFLVDDHLLFRMGLKSALSDSGDRFVVTGEAASSAELLEHLPTLDADVVILDIMLPDRNGLDVAVMVREQRPSLKILVMSSETDEETVARFLKVGLEGFVSKAVPVDELFRAVEYVAEGAEYYGRDIASLIHYVRVNRKEEEEAVFTPRENEVIRLCAEGLSAKEISERLSINIATVNTHKNNIFKKLGINSSVGLARYAIKHGIINL